MTSRSTPSKPELGEEEGEQTIRVITTVTEGGRLRLPNVVRHELKIERGAQLVIYLHPARSFFVAVPAEQAIKDPPVKMQVST